MWYQFADVESVPTPALIVYRDRVVDNIDKMVSIAGGVDRLYPHVKTHKMDAVTRLYLAAGITKFKCSTLREAEMAGRCGAQAALLAHQPVGPGCDLLMRLTRQFPATQFGTIVDDAGVVERLSAAAVRGGVELDVWLDVDVGMHRTGTAIGLDAEKLYAKVAAADGLRAAGLHVYDGHLRDSDLSLRTTAIEEAFSGVLRMRDRLLHNSADVKIIAGGTPSFPVHARHNDRFCSPGTPVFWDLGYQQICPDLQFDLAALVMTRVISKPTSERVCVDLGHKAVAAENPPPRVRFLGWEDMTEVGHSEEHLVLETNRAEQLAVGDVLFGIPRHICPTVALYSQAVVIQHQRIVEIWQVTARDRMSPDVDQPTTGITS